MDERAARNVVLSLRKWAINAQRGLIGKIAFGTIVDVPFL